VPEKGTLKIVVEEPGLGAHVQIIACERGEEAGTPTSPNSTVWEAEIAQRETPVHLPNGTYEVKLSKELFVDQTQQVKIAGQVEPLSFNLVRRFYRTKVRVESHDGMPLRDVTVHIDDKSLEFRPGTPLDLRAGEHTLLVEASDCERQTKRIVVPSREGEIVVTMAPTRLPIQLVVEPANARVEIGDKALEGESPHEVLLMPGSHQVAISSAEGGFETLRKTILVNRQMDVREFHFQLSPQKHELQIITNPVDATVEVDGEKLDGRSPFILSRSPGSVRIRVSANEEEYLSQERVVPIAPDAAPCEFTLQRLPRVAVSFHSEPTSATVYEIAAGKPDKLLGITPFEISLAPGYHRLRLDLDGVLAVSSIHVSNEGGPFFFDLESVLASRLAAAHDGRTAESGKRPMSLAHDQRNQ